MELKPSNIPVTLAIPMDWRVVLFTGAISIATGVVFGLAPALRASAVQAARVLKEESQTGSLKKSRLRSALVVAQMAMCMVLLTGASLCVRSLMNANAIDAGFDIHHIALASLDPGSLGYTPEKVNDFYARLLERVERLPGVTSASYAQFLPLGTTRSETSVGKRPGQGSERDDGGRVPRGAGVLPDDGDSAAAGAGSDREGGGQRQAGGRGDQRDAGAEAVAG